MNYSRQDKKNPGWLKNALRYFQIKATKKANALTEPVEKKEKKVKEKILLKIL